jgi:hypothetical protein
MKQSVAKAMARIEIAPDDAAAVIAGLKQKGIFRNSVEIRHGEEIKRSVRVPGPPSIWSPFKRRSDRERALVFCKRRFIFATQIATGP